MKKKKGLLNRIGRVFVVLAVITLVAVTSCEEASSSDSGKTGIAVSVVGEGTVSMEPSGGSYDEGTVVTLTAEPESGYTFYGFEGDVVSTNSVTEVTVGTDPIRTTAYMPVFMTNSKSVVVRSVEDPITHMNLVEFLVDLNQSEEDLADGDGYRVWIWPEEGSATAPDGGPRSRTYRRSTVLSAKAQDVSRGGWWSYEVDSDEYQIIDGGSVEVWRVEVNYWDDDEGDDGNGENRFVEAHDFTFPVSVD